MTELINDLTVVQTTALLTRYGFELRGYSARELIDQWLKTYKAIWVRLAVVEALYQGRYKAISVEQILKFWFRRGNPNFHFTHEFERLICHNLPRSLPLSPNSSRDSLEKYQKFVSSNQDNDDSEALSESSQTSSEFELTFDFPDWDWQTKLEELIPLQQPSETIANSEELTPPISSTVEETPSVEDNWKFSVPDQTSSSERNISDRSIRQFTPILDGSEFYSKLKAVAQQGFDEL